MGEFPVRVFYAFRGCFILPFMWYKLSSEAIKYYLEKFMKRSTLFILAVAAASFAVFCGIAVNTEANDAFAVTDAVADPAPTPVEPAYSAQLVSLHNELRQKYNVPPLAWDSALANTAQAWAERIALSGMTPPEHRQIESIGENIVWGTSGVFTPQFLVDRWSREAANFDIATNTCTAGKYCVHFTQMVWSTTTKLGCGKATTADGKTDFVVCDYNPRGNMVGQSPFKTLPTTTPKATAECEACGKKVQDLTAQVEKLKQEIAAASDQKIKDDVKVGTDLLRCEMLKSGEASTIKRLEYQAEKARGDLWLKDQLMADVQRGWKAQYERAKAQVAKIKECVGRPFVEPESCFNAFPIE